LHDSSLSIELATLFKVEALHGHGELLFEPLSDFIFVSNPEGYLLLKFSVNVVDLGSEIAQLAIDFVLFYLLYGALLVLIPHENDHLVIPAFFETPHHVLL
jgi:hypothetical protein